MKRVFYTIPLILLLGVNGDAKIVDRIVAQVNDDIITLSDLNREMSEIRQDLATKFTGEQLDQEIKKAEKDVLDQLIRQKLLIQKANELGFSANIDSQVNATIDRIRKENKIKDMADFERALSQQGMTLAMFRDRIRKQIITNGLVSEFVGSRITLLSQELEKYYQEHIKEFSSAEEVTLSEIVIPTTGDPGEAKSKADEIVKKVAQGEPFATLASQYSAGPTASKGGSIGTYLTAKLNPDIAMAIAKVKEGDITPVISGADMLVIYRVDTRKEAQARPLDEVRDEIRSRIYEQKFTPELERFISQLKEDAYIQIFADK
jgi:peptidyl-prolyl cis-trans isomerase SurA